MVIVSDDLVVLRSSFQTVGAVAQKAHLPILSLVLGRKEQRIEGPGDATEMWQISEISWLFLKHNHVLFILTL